MKKLIIIFAMLITIGAMAQVKPIIYKVKFNKEKVANGVLQPIDSLVLIIPVNPLVIGYNKLDNGDSTAIFEDGVFYDILSEKGIEYPQLDIYIIKPYPTKFSHSFYGLTKENAIFKE